MGTNNHLNPKSKTSPIRAVALLSGGMDSTIAAKIIEEQGIEIFGINFHSPFCVCNSKSHLYQCGALYFAQKMNIPISIFNRSDNYLQIVRDPKFGFGRNKNPCIDCQIYSLINAHEYAKEIGASFLISGEILGDNPSPQVLSTLMLIEQEAGLSKKIIRPLSIKHFPPTDVESAGIIDRNKLLEYHGVHENVKLEPGKPMDSTHIICASGGCLLSDEKFAVRLNDYFKFTPNVKMEDMKWLKIGVHYRMNSMKVIVGNNTSENRILDENALPEDLIVEVQDESSPFIIIKSFFKPQQQNLYLETFSKSQKEIISFAVQIAYQKTKSSKISISTILRKKPDLIQIVDIKFEKEWDLQTYLID